MSKYNTYVHYACPQIRYWRQHEREAAADRVRTAGLETTARVSGLRPSTRYHVAVLAYNSAGTGPPSPRTTVTTRKPRMAAARTQKASNLSTRDRFLSTEQVLTTKSSFRNQLSLFSISCFAITFERVSQQKNRTCPCIILAIRSLLGCHYT